MKRAVKFMNVEQVDYVAGISHKGPVLVLHDDYMLEHGTFLEFTNDLDSQNMYRIKVATTPSPLQWTNSSKVSGKTDFFFKVSLSDEAQIYLSCLKYFILSNISNPINMQFSIVIIYVLFICMSLW